MYANYYRVNPSKNVLHEFEFEFEFEFEYARVFKYVCVHRRDVSIIKEAGGIFLEVSTSWT